MNTTGRDPSAPHRAFWLSWKEVQVGGRPVSYGEAGAGAPAVFLHGWGLDHRVYKRSLARLAAGGLHVLAPALPGFGGTASLPGSTTTLPGLARWLAAFLDAVGVRSPVLVIGHSFGGGVGIVFAHDHPARVRGLVLVNSIGASAWARRGAAPRTMAQRPLWDWGVGFPGDLWPPTQGLRVLPAVMAEGVRNLVRDPRALWRAAELARRADLTGELQVLGERRLPVAVLWGTRDRVITRAAFEEMCEALGDPHAVTVEGSHGWLIVDPDAFGEVMTNVVGVAVRARGMANTRRAVTKLSGRVARTASALRRDGRGARRRATTARARRAGDAVERGSGR